MNKFQIPFCAAAAVLLSAGASQASNLIANGDFETGSLSPAWTASGVVQDLKEHDYQLCCGFSTSHPDNHIAAFGGGTGSGMEVLSQSFATVSGAAYQLDYDWGFIGGQANQLSVTVGGVTHNFCCSGTTNIDAAYAHDIISFIGSGLDTVSFTVFDNPVDSTDTIVDNVSVSGGVPEPAAWAMMISGFGLAGAALRRRRTAVAAA